MVLALVDFYVDFEFRSKFLQTMIGTVFNEAVRIMVHPLKNAQKKSTDNPNSSNIKRLSTASL